MIEENIPQGTEQVAIETPTEPSTIEQQALSMGWRPKEEFNGDEDAFIDAKEFVRRQPLFEKIETQNRKLKTVERALEELKTHYTNVRETEYVRAMNDLKAQRKEALSNGDGDRFEQLDDQIKEVEKQKEQLDDLRQTETVNEPHPEFVSWKQRNKWYDTVGYMKEFADQVGREKHARGLAPNEVLREVEKAVRAEFPQKFVNPNKANAAHLESSGTGRKSASESFELTDQERKIMNDFVRTKVMTKEEYIKDLKTRYPNRK